MSNETAADPGRAGERCPRCQLDLTRCRSCGRLDCPLFAMKAPPTDETTSETFDRIVAAERDCVANRPDALRTRAIAAEAARDAWANATYSATPADLSKSVADDAIEIATLRGDLADERSARERAVSLTIEACDALADCAATLRGEDTDPDGEKADGFAAVALRVRKAIAPTATKEETDG